MPLESETSGDPCIYLWCQTFVFVGNDMLFAKMASAQLARALQGD